MVAPRAICLRLDRHIVWRAFSLAWAKTGKRMAARMAMIAMTTSSSIRVKPRWGRREENARFIVGPSVWGAPVAARAGGVGGPRLLNPMIAAQLTRVNGYP